MEARFSDIITDPSNLIFHVVFFPDRVYHAQYLNATRSARYRYDVDEVRGKADINVLKGCVWMDGTRGPTCPPLLSSSAVKVFARVGPGPCPSRCGVR